MRRLAALTIVIVLATTACWPFTESTERDDNQQPPTTDQVVPGAAFVETVEFLYLESYPVQVRAIIRGSLPTPCHDVVWTVDPTDDGAIVEISSAVGAGEVCTAVMTGFEITVDVGDYTSGDYSVIVNGEDFGFTI